MSSKLKDLIPAIDVKDTDILYIVDPVEGKDYKITGEILKDTLTIAGPQGDSAYQVAVDNGFEGTEQEWLDSLVGAPGAPGADGEDGADGPNEVSTTTATDINGLLKGNGSTVSAAVAGTDYAAVIHTHTPEQAGADPAGTASNLVGNLASTIEEDLESKADLVDGVVPSSQLPDESVTSVNGKNGIVELDYSDVGAAADNDSRLSDARTPTAHKGSHATGGSDALSPSDIGALPANDASVTNARTPTAHAASHATGGGDAIEITQAQVNGLLASLAALTSGKVSKSGDTMTGSLVIDGGLLEVTPVTNLEAIKIHNVAKSAFAEAYCRNDGLAVFGRGNSRVEALAGNIALRSGSASVTGRGGLGFMFSLSTNSTATALGDFEGSVRVRDTIKIDPMPLSSFPPFGDEGRLAMSSTAPKGLYQDDGTAWVKVG